MSPRRRVVRKHVRLWSKREPRAFWEIEQIDAVLTRRFGKLGKSTRITSKKCRDWFFAGVELERAIAAQIAKGFTRQQPRGAAPESSADEAAREILDELDRLHGLGEFPDLESFEWVVVGARLHLFANPDKKKWGIAIEEITYGQNARRKWDVLLRLHRFGNAFTRPGAQWLRPFDAEGVFDEVLLGPDESAVCLTASARHLRSWKKKVAVSHDLADYRRARVRTKWPALIQKRECLALLMRTERDAMFAPATEVRRWASAGTKHLLALDEWDHPDGPPSESATFRRFARTLVSGDAKAAGAARSK